MFSLKHSIVSGHRPLAPKIYSSPSLLTDKLRILTAKLHQDCSAPASLLHWPVFELTLSLSSLGPSGMLTHVQMHGILADTSLESQTPEANIWLIENSLVAEHCPLINKP
jgi:hypothetical protein